MIVTGANVVIEPSAADNVFFAAATSAPDTLLAVSQTSHTLGAQFSLASDPLVIWDSTSKEFHRTSVGVVFSSNPGPCGLFLDSGIEYSRSVDGCIWTPIQVVSSSRNSAEPTYTAFHDHSSIQAGKTLLCIQWNAFDNALSPDCSVPTPQLQCSTDHGVTWSAPFPSNTNTAQAVTLYNISESFAIAPDSTGSERVLVPWTSRDFGNDYLGIKSCNGTGSCGDVSMNQSEIIHSWYNNNIAPEWANGKMRVSSNPGIACSGARCLVFCIDVATTMTHRSDMLILTQYTAN
jgi:hypothetical protein